MKSSTGCFLGLLFGNSPPQSHDEAQTILQVPLLGLANQPLPIEVGILNDKPRQGFRDPDL